MWARMHGAMGTYTRDGDGRITEEEELVKTGDDDGPYETDKPCAEGGAGHVWVVGVGDGRPDLGVGRVILWRRGVERGSGDDTRMGDVPRTAVLIAWNAGSASLKARISVGQTKVKSLWHKGSS